MTFNKKLLISSIALAMLSATAVQAAERNFLQQTEKYQQALLNEVQSLSGATLTETLGLGADETLEVRRVYTDADGMTTTRYQQTFKGLPVIGDDVVISRKSGAIKRAHGAVLNGIGNDAVRSNGKLKKDDAVRLAKIRSRKQTLVARDTVEHSYDNEQSRLAIWQDDTGTARLVYEVSYMQHGDEPTRPYMILDADTGDVLQEFDNLQTANATGPGGNTKTGIYYYGTNFGYNNVTQSGNTCTMTNSNVKTINLNHGTSGSTAFSFTCPENTVKSINGAYSPLNDAHYFGGVVYDMYNAWVGSAPLTFQLKMRVHYSNNYENAFWDGSAMSFGDGASTFYPLVSLDVSAHEVSHGFTEQNSGLVYSGKSGGLNEAFSDMAGEAAEFYMNGSNDWKVGAQIFKGNGALRYMNDPTLDGKSIGHQADYTNGMDVHYSSGVYNKAFYLLSTTSGWTVQKAFKVYARANQLYWTANTNWNTAGNGVLDAACDLGYNVAQVKSTLSAVGITSNASDPNCGGTTPPTGSVLQNGVPKTGLSASTGNDLTFTMTVPAGATNVKFAMSGGSGDADLYVKFGSAPTDTSYDCRPYASGNSETCTGTQSGGVYYVRVKAYSTFSGVSLTGSYTEGGTGPAPIDTTVANISVAKSAWKYYTVELAAGYSNLTVSISGGSGDADLYVRRGAQPTTSSYDCRPYKNGNAESCPFTNPASGTWHIGIRGYSAASGVTLRITATPQ